MPSAVHRRESKRAEVQVEFVTHAAVQEQIAQRAQRPGMLLIAGSKRSQRCHTSSRHSPLATSNGSAIPIGSPASGE